MVGDFDMVEPIFTRTELGEFSMKQLRRLANYYQVAYNRTTKKSDLIDSLFGVLGKPDPMQEPPPYESPRSARIRRIHERENSNG